MTRPNLAHVAYGERTRWDHRYAEFIEDCRVCRVVDVWHEKEGLLVRQQNGAWRLTTTLVCSGNDFGPGQGHRSTHTMSEQEAANLLLDWDEDLEDAMGLENYV